MEASLGGKSIIAGILLTVVGILVYMVEPLYLGALARQWQFTPSQLGLLIGGEVGAMLLASATAPYWIALTNLRYLALASMSCLILGNLLSLGLESFTALLVGRVFTGLFGAGICYTIGIRVLGAAADPERAFSLSVLAQVGYGSIGLFAFPFLLDAWGITALFLSWAGLGLLLLPALAWLPTTPQSSEEPRISGAQSSSHPVHRSAAGLSGRAMRLLCAQGVWYLGVGALWAFIERIGEGHQLAADEVGLALSLGMLVSLAGSLQAAWMGERFGTRWQMPTMVVAHLSVFAWLLFEMSGTDFLIAMLIFNYFWNLALPYLLGAISRSDPDGRATVLIPALQTGGNMLGPMLAGILVTGSNYDHVVWFVGACYIVLLPLVLGRAMASQRVGQVG